MSGMKRILAPTDLSGWSTEGVRTALETAKAQGGEVLVYHVIEESEIDGDRLTARSETHRIDVIEERKRLLAAFMRKNFADLLVNVNVRQEVEIGAPYRRILDRAAEEGSDLIVITTHGSRGLFYGLIGEVAEMVVRLASCPVLSVHPAKRQDPTSRQWLEGEVTRRS